MSRQTCYIAGPFAGTTTDDRVVWLGRLAMAMGYAPVVIHPAIRLGVYGDDNDDSARTEGLDAAKAIAMGCDEAWCLLRDDGTMSDGCRHELWHRRYRGGTWAEWQAVARVLAPGLLEVASEPAPRKVAPPWRADSIGGDVMVRDGASTSAVTVRDGGVEWTVWRDDGRPPARGKCSTMQEAMAAADAALIADGWELEGGPATPSPRKVAPPWVACREPGWPDHGWMRDGGARARANVCMGGAAWLVWLSDDTWRSGLCETLDEAKAAADAALLADGWELA